MGGQPIHSFHGPIHGLTGTVVEFPTSEQNADSLFTDQFKPPVASILRKPTDSDGESPILPHQHFYHATLDRPPLLELTIGDDEAESSLSSSQHTLDSPEAEYTPNRVHFRPRVRITSGINRHRHSALYPDSSPIPISPNIHAFSPDSSLSSSPSSSISVPLRSPEDETKPGWGPLGRRVSLLTEGSKRRARLAAENEERAQQRQKAIDALLRANEQTPLLRPHMYRRRFSDGSASTNSDCSMRDEEEHWRAMEINRVFGPWPGRLLNHQWWWWQLEPVICCRCLDEPDDEHY